MAIDAFEMALVHRTFRDELANVPGLIRTVEAGDTHRAKVVSNHLANMTLLVHHHHAAEDDLLWPLLAARTPVSAADVTRMRDEHDDVTAAMERVDAVRPVWAATANPARAEELIAGIEELSARLGRHLTDEEECVVPLINAHITIREWHAFLARGAAILAPGNVQFVLAFAGFVLKDASADQRRRFLEGVPAGPRLLLRLIGPWAFKSYRAKVYGERAAP
ncbi:MAG: hemerythrin domain-containing protein [Mycobacterium sp.]